MKNRLILIAFFFSIISYAQETESVETEISIQSEKVTVNGSLITPKSDVKVPLVILIPGSGPTDRNGNQSILQNNSLKYLAKGLSTQNIATYRYDKSAIALSKIEGFKQEDVSFDDFIADAKFVINYFKNENKYSKIIVAGHSQGSLVGMIASPENVDGYISIAGAGRIIDEIIIEQIGKQAPTLVEDTKNAFEKLRKGETAENVNPMLNSILNLSIQPFMMSWIKYNPQDEIKKLDIPILIINGTKDIQVTVSDAKLLHTASPNSELIIIENMNHIFKEITDDSQNMASYTNPELPVMDKLVETIATFVNK